MTDPTHFAIVSSDGLYFNLAIATATPLESEDGQSIVGWFSTDVLMGDPVRLEVPAGRTGFASNPAMGAADFRIEWEDTYRPVGPWVRGASGAASRPLVRK